MELIAVEMSTFFSNMIIGAAQLHIHRLIESPREKVLWIYFSDPRGVECFHRALADTPGASERDLYRGKRCFPKLELEIVDVKAFERAPQGEQFKPLSVGEKSIVCANNARIPA